MGRGRGIGEHNHGTSVDWWGHPPGRLTEHPQPNEALHLTASSLCSYLAAASGGR